MMERNVFARGEFMNFLDRFLDEHPEVVKDQQRGWDIYWKPQKVNLEELGYQQSESVLIH
jgi:hypothetical protein